MAKRILGVLGGQDLDDTMFKSWAAASDILVAADAGADLCLKHGIVPDAIVGDLDSVSEQALMSGADIYKFEDTNFSDCDKLLQWVTDRGHDSVTLIGVEGDRLDHVLGTLGSCIRSSQKIEIVLRDGMGHILRAGEHSLATTAGLRISLLPLGVADGVTARGLTWSIQNQTMSLGGFVSLSNVATGATVEVSIQSGVILAVLESLDILGS